jgi:photosystem II stability/assembly factor-like uncharacterized protein
VNRRSRQRVLLALTLGAVWLVACPPPALARAARPGHTASAFVLTTPHAQAKAIRYWSGVGGSPSSGDASPWSPESLPKGAQAYGGSVNDSYITCTTGSHCWLTGAFDGAPAVFSTVDGGKSWQSHLLPTRAKEQPSGDISCLGTARCWASGFAINSKGATVSVIFATTDGGRRWTIEDLPYPDGETWSISCATRLDCMAYGQGLFTTTDGGRIWRDIPIVFPGPFSTQGAEGQQAALSCVDARHCWLVGGATLHGGVSPAVEATADDGVHWSLEVAPVPPSTWEFGKAISCASASVCSYISDSIRRQEISFETTSNGGRTWRVSTSSAIAEGGSGISCPTSSFCAVADLSHLSFTTNGGVTWEQGPVEESFAISFISCRSQSACWATGGPGSGPDAPPVVERT